MNSPTFIGTIKDGKFALEKPDYFKKYIQTLEGKKIKLSVKLHRRTRTTGKMSDSSNQNGHLWGVVYPILCDYFGYSPDEMHQAIKCKFLRIGGTDDLPKIRSSATLNTLEWEDLMENIRVWALTDYNIQIPTVAEYYGEE